MKYKNKTISTNSEVFFHSSKVYFTLQKYLPLRILITPTNAKRNFGSYLSERTNFSCNRNVHRIELKNFISPKYKIKCTVRKPFKTPWMIQINQTYAMSQYFQRFQQEIVYFANLLQFPCKHSQTFVCRYQCNWDSMYSLQQLATTGITTMEILPCTTEELNFLQQTILRARSVCREARLPQQFIGP